MKGIFSLLEGREIDEIGFLHAPNHNDFMKDSYEWLGKSTATNPRTVWFPHHERLQQHSLMKSRFIPMTAEKHRAWIHGMGPFPAVAARSRDIVESLVWRELYAWAGELEEIGEADGWIVWRWASKFPARRALMICHHCGVLPDLRRQLFVLNVRGEFHWLCDGKGPMGDAWPSTFGIFENSAYLLKGPLKGMISAELAAEVRKKYDLVCSSHCLRYPVIFAEFGLPLLHINSTRFGNEVTCRVEEFGDLCKRIDDLVAKGQLTIVHNNLADAWYSGEYVISLKNFPVIPSICEHALRFRIGTPSATASAASAASASKKFLVWDTRFHVLSAGASQTLRRIVEVLRDTVDVSSILHAKQKKQLDDDMLEAYDAVIHIPYNISTMSFFEQGSANIPIWVPTARLLKQIMLGEYNEMSWYCFGADKSTAERPDRVWDADVLEEYILRSDFYTGVFNNLLFFDSVEELRDRLFSEDYDAVVKKSYGHTVAKKAGVVKEYAEVLKKMNLADKK
jgi:hypothetical protein